MHLKQALIFALVSFSLWAQAPAAADKVVATVGGKDITATDIEKMMSMFNPQDLQAFQQNPQYILSQYFLFVDLARQAEQRKLLDKSPYKEQFEGLKLQLLRNARVNEENNSFPVSPEMVDAYYKEHSAQFEQAKIKVIYIPFAGTVPVPTGTDQAAMAAAAKAMVAAGQSKRPEAEALALANDIVKQLRGGADFVKMVDKYSEDPASKAAGGDFPPIKTSGEFPAELKTAVFAMKPGDISEPIRQPTAFYIVRLEGIEPQPVREVGEVIVTTIRNDHMNQWMKEMNASHQAVITDPDFFKAPGAPAVPGGFTIAPPKN